MIRLQLTISLLILSLISPQASAFFQIWNKSQPQPQPQVDHRLAALREAGCGNPEFAVEKFGENAFMRGELSRDSLSPEFQRALAAATIAEEYATATKILGKFLADTNPHIASIAHLQLAWNLLRNTSDLRQVTNEVRRLLGHVDLDGAEADSAYILAVLAYYENRDEEARRAAEKALSINLEYYNARILLTILNLKRIDLELFSHLTCEQSITAIEDAIVPVLKIGACPLHVAHLNLSVRRVLGEPMQERSPEAAYIRSVMLAYVSRNNTLRNNLLDQYRRLGPEHQHCLKIIGKYEFGKRDE